MEQGTIGADKQMVVVTDMSGVNRIPEVAAQFVKMRNRSLKVSGMGLSSVLGFMLYGRKAVSQDREKPQQNNPQNNGEERVSGKGIITGRSVRASRIEGNKPWINIERLPVFLKENMLRIPIARAGKLRIVESAMNSRVMTSPDSHEAISFPGKGRQPLQESEGKQIAIGKNMDSRRKNALRLNEQKTPTIVAPLYVQKTGTGIERIRAIGGLRRDGELAVAYDLRTSGGVEKSLSRGGLHRANSSLVMSSGMLQRSTVGHDESGRISRNNLNRSIKPVSLKPNFSKDGSVLSNVGKSGETQFDLPTEGATGKERRRVGRNGNQRNQAVKVEINQPLIGSVTIQTSRGDTGVYELRSKIEGVLMDILESVNTIG